MICALLFCLASAPLGSRALGEADLAYRIERVEQADGEKGVRVHMELAGSAEGVTHLRVQPHWGGVSAGGEDVGELSARAEGGSEVAVERSAPHRWRLEHEPGARLSVTYGLAGNGHKDDPDPAVNRRPIVTAGLFHAIGELFLAVPDHVDGESVGRHTIEWAGFEETDGLACSFGVGPGPHVFEGSVNALRHSVFLGGDVDLVRRDVRGEPVWLAAERPLSFDPEPFADLLAVVVESERDFFDDHDHPFYLVTVVEVGASQPGSSSYGGTALTDSFALALSPGMSVEPGTPSFVDLARLLAHEHFHEWNGLILRLENEELGYWFSEGFTDFFARRLLLRGGFIEIEGWIESMNAGLCEYWTSPARDAPNVRVREAFWTDRAVGDLPYRRGDLVALMLDHAIRERSGGERSLDDLMRELVARGRAGYRASTDSLLATFEDETSAEVAARLRALIVDGALPELEPDTYAPCLVLGETEAWPFDPGFDVDASLAAGSAVGVREDGPAFAAGLREGQAIAGWSVHHGNADQPVVLQLAGESEPRQLSFLPRGPSLRVPTFSLAPGVAPEECEDL